MKRTVLGLGCFLVSAVVWGQDAADPPSRVGRISYVEGPVSFRPASVEDWVPATLNYPLTTGDSLWTAENAYAEIHIGAIAIQFAPQTLFTLSYLDDSLSRMSLSQGTVFARVPLPREGEAVEVDTPNGAISLLQSGSYRVDVDGEHNVTSVTVRSGEADVAGDGRTFKVRPGRMVQLVADQEVADLQDAAAPDDWERACAARDESEEQALAVSENYVPPEMDGAEDLAQYGEWSMDASFGAVWTPVGVTADWAPYRNGHWAFVPPWGWTWIDDAPWGFAPFHFGRWSFSDGRWVWVPGRRAIPPVYSPALVVFRDGPRLRGAVPARTGPVAAWIALGPGEIYRPPYPASAGYLRRVNAASVEDRQIISSGLAPYGNRDHVVVVPRETLTGSQPVASAVIRVPGDADLGTQPVSIATLQPARQSSLGLQAGPRINVATPPPAAVSRGVIGKHQIPRAASQVEPSLPVAPTVSVQPRESVLAALPPVNRAASVADPIQPSRGEQQRVQQPPAEQQRLEQQRVQQQQADQQRSEQQRAELQRAEQQRAEQQRAEQQRAEQQRAEQQRAEQQRAEQQRAEQQRAADQRKADEAKKAGDAKKQP